MRGKDTVNKLLANNAKGNDTHVEGGSELRVCAAISLAIVPQSHRSMFFKIHPMVRRKLRSTHARLDYLNARNTNGAGP